MIKNRVIVFLLWSLFLAWIYGRDRMTREEHLKAESERFAEEVGYDDIMQKFAEDLETDPGFKKFFYERQVEEAIEEVENDEGR